MASLNRVIVMGNLGQDPELRYTASQTPVVTLNVATTDYRSVDGQRQEQTEWHRVVVWGKQAENSAKYLSKGRAVLIEGRLQTRSWEDKSGQKRYTTEIVAQTVKFLGGARSDGASSSQGSSYNPSTMPDQTMESQDQFGAPDTPGLDDIPF